MFKLFKKKEENVQLHAPVNGKCIQLEDVPDEMFALMGKGCAFVYEDNVVHAPCDGEITLLANTLHAFGIKAENGAEILVHIGMDTVNLNGKGFSANVKQGDIVKAGDPVITIDRQFMKDNNADLTTPVIVTNPNDFDISINDLSEVKLEDIIMNIKSK